MKKELKTTDGKKVYFVGMGVCGQPIVQIKISKGSKKTHKAWKLARVIRGDIVIEFGSKNKYKLYEVIK